MGINKLGFTEKEILHMYFGKWSDLFEVYKSVYNFETTKQLYPSKKASAEPKGSIMDL